jgi:hypothetical protein
MSEFRPMSGVVLTNCGLCSMRGLGMAEKEKGKYQRCDECHGNYLIVFECKDKKKRCARCKGIFNRKDGRK